MAFSSQTCRKKERLIVRESARKSKPSLVRVAPGEGWASTAAGNAIIVQTRATKTVAKEPSDTAILAFPQRHSRNGSILISQSEREKEK